MSYKSNTLYQALLLLTPFSAAWAVEQLPTIHMTANNMTANRTVLNDQNTMAGLTVIDREQIERQQFQTLEELLKTVPSLSFRNSGGMGKTTGISLRGTSSQSVLVLVDGQKIASATTGTVAFEHLPIDQIERVEIIRGPRSSLYGAEAIAGVIQIFTRQAGHADGMKPYASVSYGSHESYKGNIGVNLRQGASWANLNATAIKTQGINATRPTAWGHDPDRDGYESSAFALKAGHQFSDQFEISSNLLSVDAKNEYDNGPDAHGNIKQNVYGLAAKYKPVDRWQSELKVGRTEDKLESVEYGTKSKIDTLRDNISWLNSLTLQPNQLLMLGIDYQHDKVNSSTNYTQNKRDNTGYFVQYLAGFGAVNVQAAFRFDDNQQYGQHSTGNATLGYHLNDHYHAYATWGKAFRMPTFNELYWPADPVFGGGGNPDLKPEQAENLEIGLKGSQYLDWQLNAFMNNIDHMIVGWPAQNVDKARVKGIELVLGQNLHQWVWNLNYTYQDPKNRSGAYKNKQVVYTAKQLLNFSADYKIDKWLIGGAVHYEDKRFVNAANTQQLSDFTTADVRVTYQLTPTMSVQAKLANMFDKTYQSTADYNQDGRTAWLTLRYAMQ
ncbi:TonB-dependent receptor domain-containing protein [Acinetobacter larvae]|uniref:TonB-dependent receptor n=1 Tax=Acinetobacter larvae TaxID=1789224 RepID=A0A1B2LX17_9GAMM|nr:TonB-dependent receptor [Acinetobacter larvae]AOA57488.1 TonB-dependent receptor [Acinetobacter larvae]